MDKTYGHLERGMPVSIPVSVFDMHDQPLDIIDQPIYFTIKSQKYDFDRDDRFAIVSKNFSTETGAKNEFVIQLTASDMDFEPGEYFFDIVIGGWRAICLPFTLIGGPTNRSVINFDKSNFSSIARPIKIIQKPQKPIVLVTDFNPYLINIKKEIEERKFLPIEVKKVIGANRLYEVWYDKIDYAAKPLKGESGGACSALRKGNLIGRKFDWLYDNTVTFFVHAPRIGSHYAFDGISRIGGMTEDMIINNPEHPDFKSLPNRLVDGINEFGLYANTNVVPLDYGYEDTVPEIEEREKIEFREIVRYVLDHFKTADEAVEYIKNYVSLTASKDLVNEGETLHCLIADARNTYVLECIHGKVVIISANYMTNFNLYRVEPNDDKTIYTPETQDSLHNAVLTNNVTENSMGLERYNLIASNYWKLEDEEDFRKLLKDLDYTRAYPSSANPSNPFWYTEAIPANGLKANSPIEDFAPVTAKMDEFYRNRSRNNPNTWQSVHSVIYNLKTRKAYVKTQEEDKEFEFSL